MSGFHVQKVIIIPSKELIIRRLAYDPEEKFDVNGFVRDVLGSLPKEELKNILSEGFLIKLQNST